jgi:hypothetical protein
MLKKAKAEATNFIDDLATQTPDERFDVAEHVIHVLAPVQAVQFVPQAEAVDGALM